MIKDEALITGQKRFRFGYIYLAFVIVLFFCFSPVILFAQETGKAAICYCKDNKTSFEQQVIQSLSDKVIAIEQDYIPVDSFGISWSTENRSHPIPIVWGVSLGSSVLVFEAALEPWKRDSFFQENKQDYYWEKGQLTSARFWTMPGFAVSSQPFAQQDSVIVDTVAQGVYSYRISEVLEDTEVLPPDLTNQTIEGYLLYFELIDNKYRFCLKPWTFHKDKSSIVTISKDLQGGVFFAANAQLGQGEITVKKAGYLLPMKKQGTEYRIVPFPKSQQ